MAAAVMAGCSNDEVLDSSAAKQANATAIAFDGAVNHSTRSADITKQNLKEFTVYGLTLNPAETDGSLATLFNGTDVALVGNAWTYSPLRYWVAGNDYMFTAIAPEAQGTSGWTFTPTTTYDATFSYKGMGSLTFNNQSVAAGQDLVYAFAKVKDAAANQAAVGLMFNHLLSRVMFTFENSFSSTGSYIEISDVKVTNVNSEGTINFMADSAAWEIAKGSTFAVDFPLTTNNGVEFNNQGSAVTQWSYFIPANQAYTLTFTVKLYSGSENGDVLAGTYAKSCTLPAMQMQPGYSYNFTASINESNVSSTPLTPITFTVTGVSDWSSWTNGGSVTF